MIDGMQTKDSAGHPKMLAYLKHYTIYSREQNRMHSEANVTDFDLHDSYLAQYEEAFKANASGVMCSESLHLTCFCPRSPVVGFLS
jgi:beta-glucosidase-like glycosyl hydrolase